MEKNKSKKGIFPTDDDVKYKGTREDKFKQSKEIKDNLYNVRFKSNRSTEILVGRELLMFRAGEINPWHPEKYSKGVPDNIINHADFIKASSRFAVTKQEDK